MDDLPLQKIQISGPTLASILQRFSFSPGDVHGLLFGRVSHFTPSNFSDDDPTAPSDSPTLIATITSFFCSSSAPTFYDSTGRLSVPSLNRLLSSSDHQTHYLLGWFSGRRQTPFRPSMRESTVISSLSSKIQFSFPVENSPRSYTFPPCIFLLLTTPFQDNLIDTHEYKAYQFRLSTEAFEPKTLDVINIGPAFRGHYGSFCPNSPFPALPCELGGLSSTPDSGTLKQSVLDMCAEDLDVGRLSRLIGPAAATYTAELEDLYKKMLAKLDGLARLVEKSSARVLEQENCNMKLRYKVAALE